MKGYCLPEPQWTRGECALVSEYFGLLLRIERLVSHRWRWEVCAMTMCGVVDLDLRGFKKNLQEAELVCVDTAKRRIMEALTIDV